MSMIVLTEWIEVPGQTAGQETMRVPQVHKDHPGTSFEDITGRDAQFLFKETPLVVIEVQASEQTMQAIRDCPQCVVLWEGTQNGDLLNDKLRETLKAFARQHGIDALFDEAFGLADEKLTRGQTSDRIKSWLKSRK